MAHPEILTAFRSLAPAYDALVCDVWGVLHNGANAHKAACEALREFRRNHGPVVLLSNAPRPVVDLETQFERFGVPFDCYDAIMTSGVAARDDLARRASGTRLKMLHLGPSRDSGVYDGLNLDVVEIAHAEIVLCTGFYDDETETPADYADMLSDLQARGLTMLCANPDLVVQRGGRMIPCAGAMAAAYEGIGGHVVYYGKPHRPIYDVTLAEAERIAGRPIRNPLAIGDGMGTDLKGANGAGIDALFIADGIHGEDVRELTPEHMAALFAKGGVHARAAMRALVW
ncbi:MAG TPA: TIGR01459 family HAD-type hydrolase [Rhizomicrobium sp.]|jgi:HAD superfamily hydrolase (TIGR01459 family)|nr:TIGR01459 family HAD-type hydrolase [Rhizomicrobium sp.]